MRRRRIKGHEVNMSVEIGMGKSARRAYHLDEVAIVQPQEALA